MTLEDLERKRLARITRVGPNAVTDIFIRERQRETIQTRREEGGVKMGPAAGRGKEQILH